MLTVLGFLSILATSIAFDGYFLWLHVSGGFFTILWRRKPIFSARIPYLQGPKVPLWIPLASLSILLSYFIIVGRRLNLRISLWRRRLHHYHLGILSMGLSIPFILLPSLPGFQDSHLWIASKGTSLSEVLEGLGFIFLIGGTSLTFMDEEDLLSDAKARLKPGRRGNTA